MFTSYPNEEAFFHLKTRASAASNITQVLRKLDNWDVLVGKSD